MTITMMAILTVLGYLHPAGSFGRWVAPYTLAGTITLAMSWSVDVLSDYLVCNAKVETWQFEVCRTRFATMEEAKPALDELERKQAATRAVFGDIPRSD